MKQKVIKIIRNEINFVRLFGFLIVAFMINFNVVYASNKFTDKDVFIFVNYANADDELKKYKKKLEVVGAVLSKSYCLNNDICEGISASQYLIKDDDKVLKHNQITDEIAGHYVDQFSRENSHLITWVDKFSLNRSGCGAIISASFVLSPKTKGLIESSLADFAPIPVKKSSNSIESGVAYSTIRNVETILDVIDEALDNQEAGVENERELLQKPSCSIDLD